MIQPPSPADVPQRQNAPLALDLQVNGYAGVDFNGDSLAPKQIRSLCQRLRDDGVEGILATVITDDLPSMIRRVSTIAEFIDSDPQIAAVIQGVHVEGPFINPANGYVGAHPADAVRPAEVDAAERLIDAGRGHVRLWTLAPEMDEGARVVEWLHGRGVTVAAGHSDASIDQLRRAMDAGLRLFTHLGNGCPALLPRHDNIVQRVLSLSDELYVSFIADGHHVPPFALANYLRRVPDEHIVIVSDAISAAGLGSGRFALGNQTVEVDEAGAAWAADRTHFAGSAATLHKMRNVLASELGVSDEQFARWTGENPRQLLRS